MVCQNLRQRKYQNLYLLLTRELFIPRFRSSFGRVVMWMALALRELCASITVPSPKSRTADVEKSAVEINIVVNLVKVILGPFLSGVTTYSGPNEIVNCETFTMPKITHHRTYALFI